MSYDVEGGQEAVIPYRREYDRFRLRRAGSGLLAGSYPNGITRIDGVPASATIRVLLREPGEGDGYLVAETTSGVDGAWQVSGLDATRRYDVVCRKDGFNDMILSNVSPATE